MRSLPIEDAVRSLYDSPRLEEHRLAVRVLQRAQQLRLGAPGSIDRPEVAVSVDDRLPPLAWLCKIHGSSYVFTAGSGVELGDDFLFEGVWDGDFSAHGVQKTDFAFGSGARWGKYAVFVPPKHCWEQLYVVHDKVELVTYVSNSLNFVLAEMNLAVPGPFFSQMASVLRSSSDAATAVGFDLYDPLVVDDDRYALYRMMFYNFTVTGDGRFRLFPSAPETRFTTFDEYESFLLDVLRGLAANGSDPARRTALRPITPISNGYDSPCVGALAARLGHTSAVTIAVTVKGHDDSGQDVGTKLGLDVDVVQHPMGENVPQLALHVLPEQMEGIAEFVATSGLGDDVMLRPMADSLGGRVLLSGAMGDSAWRRACTLPPGLPVRIAHGKSFGEFRLRVGYAFVPVPAIGARFVAPLRQVTRSAEMAPWTLNQPYDRPIPRRIVEEAGIARGDFARAKTATNPTVVNYDELFEPSVTLMVERYRTRTFTRPSSSEVLVPGVV